LGSEEAGNGGCTEGREDEKEGDKEDGGSVVHWDIFDGFS